ncbi:MAG: TonB-dependent receptor [Ferruginibacter sp.]
MKLTAIILLAACLQISAKSFTQNVTLSEKNAGLEKVFSSIKKQTGYTFWYKTELLDEAKKISISVKNATLEKVLDLCVSGQTFTYEIIGKTIVLSQKEKSKLIITAPVVLPPPLEIRGTVTDVNGKPLEGVSVIVVGDTKGVSTDANGNFIISLTDNAVLRFSYVGFDAVDIPVKNKTFINVKLSLTSSSLNGIVVVGYGTQKKRNITGAVATFNAENLDERPISRVDQALVGQMAGVRVKQTSGLPGRGFSVQIRGTGSISATTEPLYVIDGFPLEVSGQNNNGGFSTANPLDNLNTNDIESIQVLKDASSAAIYGSRASNGVVLITTKKGKSGKAKISLSSYAGYNEKVRKLDMLSPEQWVDRAVEMINTNWVKSGAGRTVDQTTAQRKAILGRTDVNLMIDDRWVQPGHPGLLYVDWQDEFFRKGMVQNYQLSASGGNEFVKYYVSGDYLDQDGITYGVGYKRYAARANIEVLASNKIKFGINLAPSYSSGNDPGVDGKDLQTHIAASLTPVVEADAGLNTGVAPYLPYAWGGTRISPIETVKQQIGETKTFRTIGTIFGDYTIIPGLVFRSSINLDNSDQTFKRYIPVAITASRVASGQLTGFKRLNFVNENTLSYTKTFSSSHNVSVLAGQSYSTFKFDNWDINGGSFGTDQVTTLNAANNGSNGNSRETKNVLISYFGRAQYDYDGRYLFSASIRRDGSSKFGANTKWGIFPAFSAGWRLSEEAFLKNVDKISELKLRGSWGVTGNNGAGDYASIELLSFANYSYNGALVNGLVPSNFANPDLGWEESKTLNAGLDLGLFNNRIFASFDYYTKRNTDLLLSIPLPTASGFSSYLTNIGEVLNKGWELEITTQNLKGKNLTWNTSLNFSHNTNKVEKLGPNNTPILFNGGFDIEHSILMVGQPMYSLFLVKEIGVLTAKDIAAGYPRFGNQEAGDPKYFDADGNNKIDANDRILSGAPNPKYIWGITNTLTYKGFDLNVLVQGQWGGKIYSMFGRAVDRTGQGYMDNALANYTNRWRSTADDGKPGIGPKAYSTFGRIKNTDWLYSADYWRVRNITLGYNLGSLVKSKVISGIRIYVTAENMFGKDKYEGGWNPEAVNTNGEDYGAFPLSKGVVAGLNINF